MSRLTSSLFIFLICFVRTLFADTVCGEWQTFKDEKCFKVFDILQTYDEAINTCNQYNATLVTITSLEEQHFIETYLFTTLKIADNVWTGLKYNNSKYKWINDFDANYTNWLEGSPKNKSDYCIQIDSDEEFLGNWFEVSCTKRNVVMCQRLPTITIQLLQNMLITTRKQTESIIKELTNKLENNIIQQNINTYLLEETTKTLNFTIFMLKTTVNELTVSKNQTESLNQQLNTKFENNIMQQNIKNQMLEETTIKLNNTMNLLKTTVKESTVTKNQFDYFFGDKRIEFQTFAENNIQKAFIYPYKTQPYGNRSYAIQLCAQHNASLVDIESIEKQKLVESFLNKINPNTEYMFYYWLGGYIDSADNNKYKWLNSGHVLIYTNWYSGEPQSNDPYMLIAYKASDINYRKWASNISNGYANVFCEISFH